MTNSTVVQPERLVVSPDVPVLPRVRRRSQAHEGLGECMLILCLTSLGLTVFGVYVIRS